MISELKLTYMKYGDHFREKRSFWNFYTFPTPLEIQNQTKPEAFADKRWENLRPQTVVYYFFLFLIFI